MLEIGRERLLDQHRDAALDRRHDRIDVQMLVGADDRGGHFRPLEQFDVALRHEVGVDLRSDLAGAVRVLLGKADPFDRRVARRHFTAEQADPPAADNGKADAFGLFLQLFSPARTFCLNSAIAEIVSLVSGRSTGSPRSAERSAAL